MKLKFSPVKQGCSIATKTFEKTNKSLNMKIYALVLSCFLFFNGFSQTKDEFIPGAYLVENNLHEDVKSAKSILIVFYGEFDVYPPKSTLEKKLSKLFRKAKMNVTFTYWDAKNNALTNPDIKTSDYEVACLFSFKYITKLNEYNDHRRLFYTQWAVKCEKGKDAASLGNATIDVYCKHYIFTEDKAISKLILSLFTK
uniref:hypothetical protein n=1 Tax=Flavobacterium sp. TaxID=239 RepID=UPI00404B5FFC